MNTDVSYKQECFRKVLNCLKNNKVMVDTRDDGIYIRLAGNEDKGEAFTLHFANAYPFDKPEQPVMAQYPNEKKDYEILSFSYFDVFSNKDEIIKHQMSGLFYYKNWIYTAENLLSAQHPELKINSVKRLLDGEIFTLGDKLIDGSKITEINIDSNYRGGVAFVCETNGMSECLDTAEKPQSPEPTKEEQPLSNFEKEIASVINRFSRENMSDTPDFILATYLNNCLNAYEKATQQKKNWFK